MLAPKRMKFRKQQKGRRGGPAKGGAKLDFGQFGLQALGRGHMTSQQIEAAMVALTRHIQRGGQGCVRVFPDNPGQQKPARTRVG